MTINECMALLVEELTAGEIPMPLAQSFTLAHVWFDLARLSGEPVPRAVAAVLDTPLDYVPVAVPSLVRTSETTPFYAD